MDLLGQTPDRKILHAPSHYLPTPLYFATVLTKCPELPMASRPLKVKPSTISKCDFSLSLVSTGKKFHALIYQCWCMCWLTHALIYQCCVHQWSWAIMFHKGQNMDSVIQANCQLEKFCLAFLWLTPASRWKWFPKVTAKPSSKVSCVENIRHDSAREIVLRVRNVFPVLALDLGRSENFHPIMGAS